MSQPTPTYPPPWHRVWPWLLIGALIGCAVLLLLWWGVVLAESPVIDHSCRIGLEHR